MTANQNKPTAADAYETAHLAAQGLVERLNELLFEMPAPDDEAVHWGHVGDLNHANQKLAELVAFLESGRR